MSTIIIVILSLIVADNRLRLHLSEPLARILLYSMEGFLNVAWDPFGENASAAPAAAAPVAAAVAAAAPAAAAPVAPVPKPRGVQCQDSSNAKHVVMHRRQIW